MMVVLTQIIIVALDLMFEQYSGVHFLFVFFTLLFPPWRFSESFLSVSVLGHMHTLNNELSFGLTP